MLYSPERGGSTIKPVRIYLPFIPILSYEQECRRVDQDIIICNFVWIADRRFLEKFFTTSVRNVESNTSCVLLTECLTLNNQTMAFTFSHKSQNNKLENIIINQERQFQSSFCCFDYMLLSNASFQFLKEFILQMEYRESFQNLLASNN